MKVNYDDEAEDFWFSDTCLAAFLSALKGPDMEIKVTFDEDCDCEETATKTITRLRERGKCYHFLSQSSLHNVFDCRC